MTRALQDRLALANIKIKHGWQYRSIDSIEPEIERELKRKRTNSNSDLYSDTSSIASGPCFSSTGIPSSSPLTGPMFSDDIPRSGSSYGSAKRFKMEYSSTRSVPNSLTRTKLAPGRTAPRSWKSAHNLPESSPIAYHKRPYPSMAPSFASETSTIMDTSSISEDDDQDLPLHSFQLSSDPQISSSPPRTPPPDLARSARLRSKAFDSSPQSSHTNGGKEGADLLLFLAASPSPAMRVTRTPMFPPSTPPTKHTPLPSSMMSTPGGRAFLGFDLNTPCAGFNFADFVNVTPSPGQGPWSRTPTAAKTPLAAREARRRLNFDILMPLSGGSPNIGGGGRGAARKEEARGLGMELGGEL